MFESDEDLLMISSLQHFLFCERQCALIHVEQIWADNVYTIQGELLHKRAHSETFEKRPGKKTEFGIPIRSIKYGITGKLDAIEFHSNRIEIVEYKRGKPKSIRADEVQLCAQALCIEEMKCTKIEKGSIYYGKIHRRHQVIFDDELRFLTHEVIKKTRMLLEEGITPPPVYKKNCKRCSVVNYCLPKKTKINNNVHEYIINEIAKDELVYEEDA